MKLFVLISILFFLGCRNETPADQRVVAESLKIQTAHSTLSTYPTGLDLLRRINTFKSTSGKTVDIYFRSPTEVHAMVLRGDYDASIETTTSGYRILIRSGLSDSQLAHVIAHEYLHILEDAEIDDVLKYRPDITPLAERTIAEMKAGRINQLNPSHVDYVLGSLFCLETRAYLLNKRLIQEGLADEKMLMISNNMASHIDTAYIQQFGTSYGSSSAQMVNWCAGFSSMTQIQNNLITNIN